jgi:hypothetical protein
VRRHFTYWIAYESAPALIAALRAAEAIGLPLGAPAFLDRLAALAERRSVATKARPQAAVYGVGRGLTPTTLPVRHHAQELLRERRRQNGLEFGAGGLDGRRLHVGVERGLIGP